MVASKLKKYLILFKFHSEDKNYWRERNHEFYAFDKNDAELQALKFGKRIAEGDETFTYQIIKRGYKLI